MAGQLASGYSCKWVKYFMISAMSQYMGAKLLAIYFGFTADEGSADYGGELDLLAVKKMPINTTVSLQYAAYPADRQSDDTTSLWLQA